MSGRIRVARVNAGPLWSIGSTYWSPALIEHAKAVPGMTFDRVTRTWQGYADAVTAVVARLDSKGIHCDQVDELPAADSWRTARSPFLFSTHKLRDYQVDGVRFLIARSREGALLADGMRLGKSCQSIIAARAFKQKTLIICPSHVVGVWGRPPSAPEGPGEVALWWPDAWKEPGGVVCLESVKPFKAQAVFQALGSKKEGSLTPKERDALTAAQEGLSAFAETLKNAQVVVCHYDIVYAWVHVLLLWGMATLICDECFPAGTLVDTPQGPRAIDRLAPGDQVLHALGEGTVLHCSVRTVHMATCRLIQTSDGREFICTQNHELLTSTGWCTANDVRPNDLLLSVKYTQTLARHHVTQNFMGFATPAPQVSGLSQNEDDSTQEGLLLDILWEETRLGSTCLCRQPKGDSLRPGVYRQDASAYYEYAQGASTICKGVQCTNEGAQSYATSACQTQGRGDAEKEWNAARGASHTRRQWRPGASSRTSAQRSTPSTLDPSTHSSAARRATAESLQDRHRSSAQEDCSRSGWAQSLLAACGGPTTRQATRGPRVARVAIPEQADFERLGLGAPDHQGYLRVHNLQVSGHPSYSVAGGLVVHNCHIVSGYQSRRSNALKVLAAAAHSRIGLSGTPVTNLPRHLHNVLEILCPGRFGFFFIPPSLDPAKQPFASYARLYCDSQQLTVGSGPEQKVVWQHIGRSNLDLPDGKTALTREETLHSRLKFLMLRRLKKDVDPQLPQMTRQIVDVAIPARCVIGVSSDMLGSGGGELRRCLDLAADGKLKSVISLVASHVAEDEKVICFCFRRLFAEAVARDLKKHVASNTLIVFVHGGLPQKERDRRIHRLRTHDGPGVLACTIDTTSTGIDLSFASVAVFGELMWEHHDLAQCLDSKTEILTPHGFVPMGAVRKGDLIAAFNTHTEELAYLPALRVIERDLGPKEQMFAITGTRKDLRVTGGHRMLIKHQFGSPKHRQWSGWRFETAAVVSQRSQKYRMPVAGYKKAIGVPLTDDQLRLIGWYLTDGTFNGHDLAISQSVASRHTKDLQRVLTGAGMVYTTTTTKAGTGSPFRRNYDQIVYHIPQFDSYTHKRRCGGWYKIGAYLDKNLSPLLFELTQRQLAVMLEAIHWGDGTKAFGHCRQTYHITTGNQTFADRLQRLCIERGFRANLKRYKSPYYDTVKRAPQPKGSIELLPSGRVSARMPDRSRLGTFHTVPAARKALRLAIKKLPDHSIKVPSDVKSLFMSTAKKYLFTINIGENNWRTVAGTTAGRTSMKRVRAHRQPGKCERVWCASNAWGTLVVRRRGQTAIVGNCEARLYKFSTDAKALIQYVIARGTGDELILRGIITKLDTFERTVGETGDNMRAELSRKKEDGMARLYAALAEMQQTPTPVKRKKAVRSRKAEP